MQRCSLGEIKSEAVGVSAHRSAAHRVTRVTSHRLTEAVSATRAPAPTADPRLDPRRCTSTNLDIILRMIKPNLLLQNCNRLHSTYGNLRIQILCTSTVAAFK